MKTLLVTLVTAAVGLLALPNNAEARPHCGTNHASHVYRSGSTSCGCAVYTKRVFAGYDCYHRPIYRYYKVPVVHRCRSHHSSPHYRSHRTHGHGNYHYHRSRSHHRSHGSISFNTRFGQVRICR